MPKSKNLGLGLMPKEIVRGMRPDTFRPSCMSRRLEMDGREVQTYIPVPDTQNIRAATVPLESGSMYLLKTFGVTYNTGGRR